MKTTPWHFWPLVILGFAWHLMGVVDYTATQAEWAPWMQMMTERQENFADRMPAWIDASWALTVWFGLVGVLLLAARVGIAPFVLAVSAIAMLVLGLWFLTVSEPSVVLVAGQTGLWTIIFAMAFTVLLWLYARSMRQSGLI